MQIFCKNENALETQNKVLSNNQKPTCITLLYMIKPANDNDVKFLEQKSPQSDVSCVVPALSGYFNCADISIAWKVSIKKVVLLGLCTKRDVNQWTTKNQHELNFDFF